MNKPIKNILIWTLLLLLVSGCKKSELKPDPTESVAETEMIYVIEESVETTEVTEDNKDIRDEIAPIDNSKNEAEKESEIEDSVEESQNNSTVTTEVVHEPTEYEKYHAMSGDEQMEVIESFETIDAFFEWYNRIKIEHDEQSQEILIEGDTIDLEEFAKNKG